MLPIRPAVQTMRPYVPGKPVEDVERELGITDLVKLNQNENTLGPSPKALAALAEAARRTNTYPEGTARALREKLAAQWNLPDDWFIVGNGSDEVFRLIAETYLEHHDSIVVPAPSYASYPMVAELMGAQVHPVPLKDDTMDLMAMARTAARFGSRLIFLCRPNNPTGAVFAQELMPAFMAAVPEGTYVVLDEAYAEFDESEFDTRALLQEYPNLIVTRTFSKIYGMAGFRLGYGIGRPEVIAPFYTVRDPFSVGTIPMTAGLAALDDTEFLAKTKAMVHDGKEYLYAAFATMGVPYIKSQSNFILFETGRPAQEVFHAMMERGVLIRPCGSFGLPTSLRVSVGQPHENERFAAVLKEVLGR